MVELILGIIANVTSMSLWLPQALTTYKNRNNPQALQGLSLLTLYLGLANTLTWGIYGLYTGDFWIGIGSVIIAPSTIAIIFWKRKADKQLVKQD